METPTKIQEEFFANSFSFKIPKPIKGVLDASEGKIANALKSIEEANKTELAPSELLNSIKSKAVMDYSLASGEIIGCLKAASDVLKLVCGKEDPEASMLNLRVRSALKFALGEDHKIKKLSGFEIVFTEDESDEIFHAFRGDFVFINFVTGFTKGYHNAVKSVLMSKKVDCLSYRLKDVLRNREFFNNPTDASIDYASVAKDMIKFMNLVTLEGSDDFTRVEVTFKPMSIA